MLAPWALHHRRWKKRIAWWLYQRRILAGAALLHATSMAERRDIRAAGLRNPIAVIPNAVDIPASLPERKRVSPNRRVLFLGRLHPVKGLDNLLEAWANVRPVDWELTLAGPDEEGYRAKLEAIIGQRGLANDVRFVGSVEGEDKWKLYRSADLFVLPTKSENFGIAIAEALACGLPVITTKGAPWQELLTHRCGWWTEIGVEPLAHALREATTLTEAQRREMGERGRQLVEQKYTWPAAAGKMLAVYEWMLGRKEEPDFVLAD
jgi:glycosyltransferase involved in cell wall biosynthesis